MPAAPQAPWGWPIMLLVLDIGIWQAAAPRARFSAAVSTRSFSSVPVPWRLA